MASKKYIVREGFVVVLEIKRAGGEVQTRTYTGGEEVTLEEDDAKLHAHKLEFANQKDRDAALAAEQQAKVATQAQQSPAELVAQLIAALSQAQAGAAAAPAAAQASAATA